jgi:hypothetical protein
MMAKCKPAGCQDGIDTVAVYAGPLTKAKDNAASFTKRIVDRKASEGIDIGGAIKQKKATHK